MCHTAVVSLACLTKTGFAPVGNMTWKKRPLFPLFKQHFN